MLTSAFEQKRIRDLRAKGIGSMSKSSNAKQSVHIRWLIRRDMDAVLEIESASFEFPWTEDEFINCLRQRDCIGMVAEYAEQVVGFMVYELQPTSWDTKRACVRKLIDPCRQLCTGVRKRFNQL